MRIRIDEQSVCIRSFNLDRSRDTVSFCVAFSFSHIHGSRVYHSVCVCVCVCVNVHEQGKDADAGVFILVIYAMPVLSAVIIPKLVEVCNDMAAK